MTEVVTDPRLIQETWEIQVPGTVRVWVEDRREGGYTTKAVRGKKGKGPRRITLTRDERQYNMELVPAENRHLCPFRNGTLAQVVDGQLQGDLTDASLMAYLEIDTEEVFAEAIAEVNVELTHRRLLELAASKGRMWQVEALRDYIDEHYPVPASGTQRTVREMYDDGEFGHTRLS